MLGKLIKYDFKALSKILLPTQIAVLCASVVGTISLAFSIRTSYFTANNAMNLARGLVAFLTFIMVMAIMASSFIVIFIIFQRFYKSFIKNEAYLTFTLPVTTTELLLSKLITALLWMLISTVTICIGLAVFILFGTAEEGLINGEVLRVFSEGLGYVFKTFGSRLVLPVLQLKFLILLGSISSILQVYLALIIGGIVAQRHKVLAGIGFYFLISMVVGFVSTTGQSGLIRYMNMSGMQPFAPGGPVDPVILFDSAVSIFNPFALFYSVVTIIVSAALFLLCRYLLTNKLNLS